MVREMLKGKEILKLKEMLKLKGQEMVKEKGLQTGRRIAMQNAPPRRLLGLGTLKHLEKVMQLDFLMERDGDFAACSTHRTPVPHSCSAIHSSSLQHHRYSHHIL